MSNQSSSRDDATSQPSTVKKFNYSDGDEFELRLLAVLKVCHDLSGPSAELSRHIVDWPSRYHLSSTRHNLLRSIPQGRGYHILELGCGCGAMTRFMGEGGAEVVAVEGSARRAQIAAERCRDLANVRVVCDHLMAFATDQRFDYVTLVGVLEYAPRYILTEDPIAACLKKAKSFLKPDGVLVVAIENQLGMKYFNGCAEDHLGTPYYGLHALYRDDEPTTFGRAALERKLVAVGLLHHRFFYPFPDYKLPQVILSDTALTTPGFDAAALLAGMASGNAEGDFHPNFYENLAWRPIIENGLLPHLANSFLVLTAATDDALVRLKTGWLASAYTANRIPAFATETQFVLSSNAILVEKRRLHPELPLPNIELPIGSLLHQTDSISNYIVGRPYLLELQQRLGRGEGIAGVIEWAVPWLDLLLDHVNVNDNDVTLPGNWIDAIPQNFIREADGKLRRIDDEWTVGGHVPLVMILVRGLLNSIGLSPISNGLRGMEIKHLSRVVAASRGIHLSEIAFEVFRANEMALLLGVYSRDTEESRQRFVSALGQYPGCHMIPDLVQDLVTALTCEIKRIKSTVSWRITMPLRSTWNLVLKPIFRLFLQTKSSPRKYPDAKSAPPTS